MDWCNDIDTTRDLWFSPSYRSSMIKMPQKYLFFCLIALFLLFGSGCLGEVIKVQTPMDKIREEVGWDDMRYEMYSELYDSIYEYDLSPANTITAINQRRDKALAKTFKIQEMYVNKLNEITKRTEFEQTWSSAFQYYNLGLLAEVSSYNEQVMSRYGTLLDTPESKEWRNKAQQYFNKSLEYRQRIEEWKP